MKKAVFGLTKSTFQSEMLVSNLQSVGFTADNISILAPDFEGNHDFGHVKSTKAPEGATTGATTGGIVGGVIGLLAGLGALAIPGVGPFIAAGPIMGALSGLGIGAAAGGIVGGLIGLGIPEFEARLYDEKLREGNFLISVHVDDSDALAAAKEVFHKAEAENISVVDEHSETEPKHATV